MKHLGYLALFIAGAIAGWTVALYWLHPPAASSDSAAWVQAVGSIAAIIASAGIVFLQASMARELSREQRRQQDAVSLSAFQGLAQHALDVVGHALNNLGDQTAARSFFRVFPPETIPSVEAMVDAFPVHQLPSKEHVLHAFQLRGLLRVIRLFVIKAQRLNQGHVSDWTVISDERDEYLLALKRAVARAHL